MVTGWDGIESSSDQGGEVEMDLRRQRIGETGRVVEKQIAYGTKEIANKTTCISFMFILHVDRYKTSTKTAYIT